jgi:hypothetical protein
VKLVSLLLGNEKCKCTMAKYRIWIILFLAIIGNAWYTNNNFGIYVDSFLSRFNFDKYFKSVGDKTPIANIISSKNETFDSKTDWENVDTEYLKKDFHTFLIRFGNDTDFQLKSIKFPFRYIVEDGSFSGRLEIYNTTKEWKEDRNDTLVYNTYNFLSEILRKGFITKDSVNVTFGLGISEFHDGEYKELMTKNKHVSKKSTVYMELKTIYKFKNINKKWVLLEIQEAYQEVDDLEGNVKNK